MKYFPLLILLPPEIVKIIAHFIYTDNCASYICNFYKTLLLKRRTMFKLIFDVLHMPRGCLISSDFLTRFKFLLNNNFSKYYNYNFWCCFLTLTSNRLMMEHVNHYMRPESLVDKKAYKNLKNCIQIWFKLCQKYNVILNITYYNYKSHKACDSITMRAKKFKKSINSFHNILYTPTIVYDTEFGLSYSTQYSHNILTNYIN